MLRLRAIFDWKWAFALQRGQLDPKFQGKGVAPTILLIYKWSLIWYKNVGSTFFGFVTNYAFDRTDGRTDRRTDRQTDRQTAFSWLDRVACNACMRGKNGRWITHRISVRNERSYEFSGCRDSWIAKKTNKWVFTNARGGVLSRNLLSGIKPIKMSTGQGKWSSIAPLHRLLSASPLRPAQCSSDYFRFASLRFRLLLFGSLTHVLAAC